LIVQGFDISLDDDWQNMGMSDMNTEPDIEFESIEELQDQEATEGLDIEDQLEPGQQPEFRLVENDQPVGLMTLGKVKLAGKAIEKRFKFGPKFTYVKNAADLKKRYPDLYNRINNARVEKDLGRVRAAGVSWEKEVVIFSDNIKNRRDLAFVMGHETIGHFGFRAVVPARILNSALDRIYNENEWIARVADEKVAVHKSLKIELSQREAVEEVISDMAGSIEASVLKRFWYAVKDFVHKTLGFEIFPDDTARYLISMSRRYVKDGVETPMYIQRRRIAKELIAYESMQDPHNSAYYSEASPTYRESMILGASNLADMFGIQGLRSFSEKNKNRLKDTRDVWRDLKDTLKPKNMAGRENDGYMAFYYLMRGMVQATNTYRTDYNKGMSILLTPRAEIKGKGIFPSFWNEGATAKQLEAVSQLMAHTTLAKMGSKTDEDLKDLDLLKPHKPGEIPVVDREVLEELQDMGRLTYEEVRDGFEYSHKKPETIQDPNDPNDPGVIQINDERKQKLKDIKEKDPKKKKEAIKKINDLYDKKIEEGIYWVDEVTKYEGNKNIVEGNPDYIIWEGYQQAFDTANKADIDLLEANIQALLTDKETSKRRIEDAIGRELKRLDTVTLDKLADIYEELLQTDADASPQTDDAHTFMKELNEALTGDRADKIKPFLEKWITPSERKAIRGGIVSLRTDSLLPGLRGDDQQFLVQHLVQNEALQTQAIRGAEKFARTSIANGHMPLGRSGKREVYIVAKNPETGEVYKVHEAYRNSFVYARTDSKAEADLIAYELQKVIDYGRYDEKTDTFNDNESTTYRIPVEVTKERLDQNGKQIGWQKVFEPREVVLEAKSQAAQRYAADPMGANLNEVVNTLSRFQIQLHPRARERLIKGLTAQNDRARDRLMRVGAPGFNPNDMIRFLSEKLEGVSSTAARKRYRGQFQELTDVTSQRSRDLWFGNQATYDQLEANWKRAQQDPKMGLEEKRMHKRRFHRYHYTFKIKEAPTEGKRYLDMASQDLEFLDSQNGIDLSDDFFTDSAIGSQLRMWTTFAQLGGSFATGLLNIIGLQTNVVPVLATYGEKSGFGGGFGLMNAQTELIHALNQSKNYKLSDSATWDAMRVSPEKSAADNTKAEKAAKEAGFAQEQVRFMFEEVREGTMNAALINALLGSARGKVTSGAAQKTIQAWMSMFSYTEQASRRATGLASFRLAHERGIQEMMQANGLTREEVLADSDIMENIYKDAKKFATDIIDQTLGEYALFNRPAFWRGDIRQFIFMYKMFPLVSVMLLSQLPKEGAFLFLGMLMLLGGIKGLPFADDMMDVADTIAQGLGLGPGKLWKGTAEKTLADLVKSATGTWSPEMMRGPLNVWFNINMSDRTSLSNMVPGTGIMLAGADTGRELLEIAGPIPSFATGAVVTVGNMAKYGLEVAGLKQDVTSAKDIFRESPFTMGRAVGDLLAYNYAGSIVNSRGYVVSEDLTAWTYLSRMLGFYPSSATMHNDVVRVATRMNNYKKELTATFRAKFIAARLADDPDEEERVIDMVDSWNEVAWDTPFEIRNFIRNSNKAWRQAEQPTALRFQKTLPRQSRDMVDELLDIYGF
jgi:hypothetical protein